MSRFHSRQDCQGGNIAVGRRYQGCFVKNFERRSFEKANLNTAITDIECIRLYRSIDSSSLQNIVSLFFLFRVRYKICTRCCQEALQRSKFDRLTLPCYTTIQIPVTRDFLAPSARRSSSGNVCPPVRLSSNYVKRVFKKCLL